MLHVRLWFRFPASLEVPPALCVAPGYAIDGAITYKNPTPLRADLDAVSFPFASGRLVAVDAPLPVLEHLEPGVPLAISFDLMTSSGRRLNGRASNGTKHRHLILPLTFTP